MIIRYSPKTREIELAGDGNELTLLAKQLLIDNCIIRSDQVKKAPFPYSENLEIIQVKHCPNHQVSIQVENDCLLVSGSLEKLGILSKNFEELGKSGAKNYHIHIEYYDDHFFLSPESMPLVVRCL